MTTLPLTVWTPCSLWMVSAVMTPSSTCAPMTRVWKEQLHARLVHQIEDQIFEYLGLIGDDWDIQVSASA